MSQLAVHEVASDLRRVQSDLAGTDRGVQTYEMVENTQTTSRFISIFQ